MEALSVNTNPSLSSSEPEIGTTFDCTVACPYSRDVMAQRPKSKDPMKTARKAAEVEKLKSSLSAEQLEHYRKHFNLFDLNGDGVISARELRKVSRKMGYRLDDTQIEVLAYNLFQFSVSCISYCIHIALGIGWYLGCCTT